MEADIVIAELLMNKTGKQMFPGVLLHEVEAPFPVNDPVNSASLRNRLADRMPDHTIPVTLHITDKKAVDRTMVAWLTAALRIKCGVT